MGARAQAARHTETTPGEPEAGAHAGLAVLNIQRTCVHDGPGLRTTVFFRGCPMRCSWCHNPEAQAFVSPSADSAFKPVAEIMEVVARDAAYYRGTHGGLTLSGGEPLAQDRAALVALLEGARDAAIPVAVETAGDVPWSTFEACLPLVDLFLFDLKVARDESLHQGLTGRPLRRARDNMERLVAAGANVRFRMCVVPGLNDTSENLSDTAALLDSLGRPSIELLRYYNLHERKAQGTSLAQEPLGVGAARSTRALEGAARHLESRGIEVALPPASLGRQPTEFTPRVRRVHQDIRDAGHAVCLESADLKTTFHKRHRNKKAPLPVQRAGQLRYVLNHKKLTVHPGELLVGNFTSKRVGGNVWVEYFGAAMVANMWTIDRQTPTSFECSPSEKLRFYGRIAPYWLPRGILPHTFRSPAELLKFAARTLEKAAGFNNNLAGIAHFIVNCDRVARFGTTGIAREVEEKRADDPGNAFYEGVLVALEALEEYAGRFASHLLVLAGREPDPRRRRELKHMAEVCRRVPRRPARTFHEALQAILFWQIALCTETFENAISLGRLDQVLQPYYEADLEAGRIDYDRARELMALFILKFDELIFLNDGDFGVELGKIFESLSPVETVTIGGTDRDGTDATNEVSRMILEVCELKPIGVNMAARIHSQSPADYVEKIAAVYLGGSPMPALYNDQPYVEALLNEHDTTPHDARDYSIVGCVEPVASDDHFANTDAANVNVALPFLQALRGDTSRLWHMGALGGLKSKLRARLSSKLSRDGAQPHAGCDPPATMDELLSRFEERLDELVRDVLADQQQIESALTATLPTPLASSLYRGCVERGKDVYEGGTTFNSSGIQALGVTDVADSLLALQELVFESRRYSLAEVLEAMDADFEGARNQAIRRDLQAAPKFGDDDSEESHLWVNRVLDLYTGALRRTPHANRDGKFTAGYYGLNANMVYGRKTPALPSGRKAGVPLANSICPHYGMQQVDLSSALNSVARVDFARYAPNGTTLTSTIDTSLFLGPHGPQNLAGLIRAFFDQGGMQFQPNLVNRDLLLDAYNNPGKHRDLVVRIAGYCAYFDDLSDDLKREILERSYYTS